jgi:hypothetical protein
MKAEIEALIANAITEYESSAARNIRSNVAVAHAQTGFVSFLRELAGVIQALPPEPEEQEEDTRVDGPTVMPPERSTASENQTKDATIPPDQVSNEHANYFEYLKDCGRRGVDALVSQAFLRAMNQTCREFAELDEAMGTPMDVTDKEAQVYRLAFIAGKHATSDGGNQPPSGLRGDPWAPRRQDDGTRDRWPWPWCQTCGDFLPTHSHQERAPEPEPEKARIQDEFRKLEDIIVQQREQIKSLVSGTADTASLALQPISCNHENGRAKLERLEKLITGALRSGVAAHGESLAGSNLGSMAKRITGAVEAESAALRAQIAQLQQKIREAHDLVSRKGQADNHDFVGCLIDGILNLKEGLSLCATEREAAEAALRAYGQHTPDCLRQLEKPPYRAVRASCTCGFDRALSGSLGALHREGHEPK